MTTTQEEPGSLFAQRSAPLGLSLDPDKESTLGFPLCDRTPDLRKIGPANRLYGCTDYANFVTEVT